MRHFFSLVFAVIATPASGSVGPPPPAYVSNASKSLINPAKKNLKNDLKIFGDQVKVYVNGNLVASGKPEFIQWWSSYWDSIYTKNIGYSMSSSRKNGDAELLVIDIYDKLDPRSVKKGFSIDSRFSTRSILYQFAKDELIHSVTISISEGFWIAASRSNEPDNPVRIEKNKN